MSHNPFSRQESFNCKEQKPFHRSSNKKEIYYYNTEKSLRSSLHGTDGSVFSSILSSEHQSSPQASFHLPFTLTCHGINSSFNST